MRLQLVDTLPDARVGGVVTMEGPATITDLFLYFTGVNLAGSHANMATQLAGPLIVSHNGGSELGDIVSLGRPQSLITMCENQKGRFVETSVNGGQYQGVLQIPFHLGNDENGIYLGPNERLQIQIGAFAGTNIEPLQPFTCEITARVADVVTRYIPRIHDLRVDLGGIRKERLPEGTAVLVLTAGSVANPGRLAVLRGEKRLLYIDWDAYFSIYQAMYESDSVPHMATDLFVDFTDLGRHLSDALGSGQVLELQDGSVFLTMMTYSLDYHVPSRTALSAAYTAGEYAKTETRLRREGVEHTMLPVILPEKAPIVRPTDVATAAQKRRGLVNGRSGSGFRPV